MGDRNSYREHFFNHNWKTVGLLSGVIINTRKKGTS